MLGFKRSNLAILIATLSTSMLMACGLSSNNSSGADAGTDVDMDNTGGGDDMNIGGGDVDMATGGGDVDMNTGGGDVDMNSGDVDMSGGDVDMSEGVDMNMMTQSGWTVMAHPCSGNRTDALHCDDDQTCYTGCGTTVPGRGMFVTKDGGKTWDTVATDPEDIFNGARVNDIWRSPDDGKLYVAGELANGFRVLSIDTDGTVGEVFKKGTKVSFSFTPGSFRRDAKGRAIAESLTGSGLVYRGMDSDDPLDSWKDGSDFWQDQNIRGGVQILAMDVHDGKFYGAGSRINQPPMAFLPQWDGEEFDFNILPLVKDGLGAFNGEMWDVDADDDGVILGGVNQAAGVGMVYFHNFEDGTDINELGSWNSVKINKVIKPTPQQATWVQGACRGANGVMYAVGRESRKGWGFVIRTTDNGTTWEDITPFESEAATTSTLKDAYRCHVTSTGGVIIAGAGGMFAVYK